MEPLTAEELAALRSISTPTVCNAIETFDNRPRNEGFIDSTITCRFPELGPVVGYAVTAKISAAEPPRIEVPHSKVWAEFERIPKPWLVVIEDLDYPRPVGSFWGEVNASVYRALGAVGTVTNGGVRDLPEVRAIGFQFFSSCLLASHAFVHIVEYGGAVIVGGLTVRPGDLLHGDEHGVTSIPHEIAGDIPQAAQTIELAERRLIDYARSPACTTEGLAEMYDKVD
jgi:4-hydroxy-4-methyl-2-oxoglutarate aldolase